MSYINHYHDSDIQKIEGSKSGKYVGFELEVVAKKDREIIAEKVCNLGFNCEHDSSICEDFGFEIVSNYGDLDLVLSAASDLADLIHGEVDSFDAVNCALHVHLTKKDQYSTAKMICFWNEVRNQDFIYEFAHRKPNAYCSVNYEKNIYALSTSGVEEFNYNIDRHCAVNALNDNTVEVRVFNGTTVKARLLADIELAYYTYEYCAQAELKDLLWYNFCRWLEKQNSKYIFPYFKTRDFYNVRYSSQN